MTRGGAGEAGGTVVELVHDGEWTSVYARVSRVPDTDEAVMVVAPLPDEPETIGAARWRDHDGVAHPVPIHDLAVHR